MRVVLVATYELGRQPFGLASPAAWLRDAGHDVVAIDTSRDPLDRSLLDEARMVAWHLPMHTATRLALPQIAAVRSRAPNAHLCAYGLYAPSNADVLRAAGIQSILGPEYEDDLRVLADAVSTNAEVIPIRPTRTLARLGFRRPDRSALPALSRYARLRDADGRQRIVGATEASRGCKHRCRHCPIVPLYDGRFRIVPADVVFADIAQQVDAGASHITFGDADFFNGVTHATRIVEGLASRHPGLTYDVTIKVEHLRRHRDRLPLLAATGCAFVTSAFESFDDAVLTQLAKGHTCADAAAAVDDARAVGLAIAPTFVAFTPWTTLEGYASFLETIAAWGLVEAVASVQLTLRLLVPAESRLLEVAAMQPFLRGYDAAGLAHRWEHGDARVDALQRDVARAVSSMPRPSRAAAFRRAMAVVEAAGVSVAAHVDHGRSRAQAIATIDEPWYC